MKKGIVKILIFLVFFCTRCYFSQAQREPASEPSEHEHPVQEHDHDVHEHDRAAKEVPKRLQQGTIEIKNITGQDINYNVSSDNINWIPHNIKTGFIDTYTQSFYILIKLSDTKMVNYLLSVGKSYSIKWDNNRMLWDIYVDP